MKWRLHGATWEVQLDRKGGVMRLKANNVNMRLNIFRRVLKRTKTPCPCEEDMNREMQILVSFGTTGVCSDYRRKCRHSQQNKKNTTTPAQKIHLSSLALRSIIRIVLPETPNVLATE